MFKEIPARLNTLIERQPKEFACLGFKVSDMDIAFKKSQMQVSTYYQNVGDLVKTDAKYYEICEKFV